MKDKLVEKNFSIFHVFDLSHTFREMVEYSKIFERYVCI